MNISKYILIIPILTTLISCSKNQNDIAIREISSDNNLFGFNNSIYNIDQEIKSIQGIDTSNLHLTITDGVLKSISLTNHTKYVLSNGVKVGNSKSEIIKLMGRPIKDEIKIIKGETQIGSIDALVYNRVIILFDENKKAKSITLETVNKLL